MNTLPYEVWSRDGGSLLCEGSFESLLAALPFARNLGEDCVIIDATLRSRSVSRVSSDRMVAAVSENGFYTLTVPMSNRADAEYYPVAIAA